MAPFYTLESYLIKDHPFPKQQHAGAMMRPNGARLLRISHYPYMFKKFDLRRLGNPMFSGNSPPAVLL